MHEQLDLLFQAQERERNLDLFETHRANELAVARAVAHHLAIKTGRTTSPEVLTEMRRLGYGNLLEGKDLRFMGAVFRSGDVWKKLGYSDTGSHRRPVPIWGLKQKVGA